MYKFYFDDVMLPVAPSDFKISVDDKDETVDLMNGGTLAILNQPGLSKFEFEFMLPSRNLWFAQYENGFREPQFYLNKIEKLKTSCKPFRFIVVRSDTRNQSVINNFEDTNVSVSIADYTITEDAEKGYAKWVNITLQQYIEYSTKVDLDIDFEKNEITINDTIERGHTTINVIANGYVTKEGDTLVSISEMYFGDPDHAQAIFEFNKEVQGGEFTPDEPITPGITLNMDKEKIEELMVKEDEKKHEEQKEDKGFWKNLADAGAHSAGSGLAALGYAIRKTWFS